MFRAKINHPYTRTIFSVATFLLITILGVAAISWQTSRGLKKDVNERQEQAVRQIDMIFDNARNTALAVQPYLDKPCSYDVVLELRRQVAMVPNIRTIKLVRGNTIYCTALFGPQSGLLGNLPYTSDQLLLQAGNSDTPNHPVISYKRQLGNDSILVGVDGYYMHNILNLLSTPSNLTLQIGSRWMDHEGHVHSGNYQTDGNLYLHRSEHYAYHVMMFLDRGQHWRYILEYSSASLFLFPILGCFMGFMAFLALGRVGTPLAMIKAGVQNREFVPYLQPVVDGTYYHLTGCEILVRWRHPHAGLIPPDQFIPLAEESGVIVEMTQQLMSQTRMFFAAREELLPDGFHFAFNICASHFSDLSLIEDCRAFISAFKNKRITLVLELTERELIIPDEVTEALFLELRRLGVLIALDDFGTGHSSLTYLQKFHIDILKIDQSFISRIGTDALSGHIVDNVIDLAQRLELMIVAEGIETEAQVLHLAPYSPEYLQGYYFGRPVTPEEFTERWLQAHA